MRRSLRGCGIVPFGGRIPQKFANRLQILDAFAHTALIGMAIGALSSRPQTPHSLKSLRTQ